MQRIKIRVAEDQRRLNLTRGLIGLSGVALVMNALLWFFPLKVFLAQLEILREVVPGWLLELGGLRATLEQVELSLTSSEWPVTPECAVLSASLVFVIFVLVFPSTATAKKDALLFGLPLLLIANLVRWWSLLWSGKLLLWKTNFFYDYIGLVSSVLLVALVAFDHHLWLLFPAASKTYELEPRKSFFSG